MLTGLFQTRAYSKRHYVIVMAFAIVLVLGLFMVEPYIRDYFKDAGIPENTEKVQNKSEYARSAPVRLVIPALKIDTTFVSPLGLNSDQTVDVPDSFTSVGWYSGGATPGEIGPAVVLGHVDSKDGPAVFFSLGQLKVGDDIEITRDDGTVAKFVVTKLERHPQSNFPTLDVYGPTDTSTLRLITCSGIFNRGEQRYSHNLVVYADLVE
jgi:sortase (surface protein transpeptidase)